MTIELIGALVTMAGGLCSGAVYLGKLAAAPRLGWDGDTADEREAIRRAELVVKRGKRVANWPMFAVIVPATLIAIHASALLTSVTVLVAAVVTGSAWHIIATRRWWRWAIRQDVDMSLVEELAEDENLVWRRHTWLGKRQRRTWMMLPHDGTVVDNDEPGVLAQANRRDKNLTE